MKYAGYVGNKHLKIRTTRFFDTEKEVVGNFEFVKPCANWEQQMEWNRQRVGNYATCPVEE